MKQQIIEVYEFGKDKHLAESDNPNYIGKLNFVFARGDWKNKNDRTYPSAILKREVERMSKRLSQQDIAGRIEHSKFGDAELHKISHVITDVKFDEKSNEAIASAKILNTNSGRDLKTLIKTVDLGASIVGRGNISNDGVVADDYSLSQIDLVKNPSFGDITKVGEANLIESANSLLGKKNESKSDMGRFYKEAILAGFKGSL